LARKEIEEYLGIDGMEKIVPILSFQDVLDSIPLDIEIAFIKKDMQGLTLRRSVLLERL
jgi:hypothetical protein